MYNLITLNCVIVFHKIDCQKHRILSFLYMIYIFHTKPYYYDNIIILILNRDKNYICMSSIGMGRPGTNDLWTLMSFGNTVWPFSNTVWPKSTYSYYPRNDHVINL